MPNARKFFSRNYRKFKVNETSYPPDIPNFELGCLYHHVYVNRNQNKNSFYQDKDLRSQWGQFSLTFRWLLKYISILENVWNGVEINKLENKQININTHNIMNGNICFCVFSNFGNLFKIDLSTAGPRFTTVFNSLHLLIVLPFSQTWPLLLIFS